MATIPQTRAAKVRTVNFGHDIARDQFVVDEYVERKGNVGMSKVERPALELAIADAFQHRLQSWLHARRGRRRHMPNIALETCRNGHAPAVGGVAKIEALGFSITGSRNRKVEARRASIACRDQIGPVQMWQDALERLTILKQPKRGRTPGGPVFATLYGPAGQVRSIFSVDTTFARRLGRQRDRVDPCRHVDHFRDPGHAVLDACPNAAIEKREQVGMGFGEAFAQWRDMPPLDMIGDQSGTCARGR